MGKHILGSPQSGRLDLNDVQVFVVVARNGTLTAAANELGVPTSTIGRSVTRLESRLNVPLLKRSARGVLLTDSGNRFLQTSKQALRTLKLGTESLYAERANPSGSIKVCCPIGIANSVLLKILPQFLRTYPDVRVELETYSSNFDQEPREDVDIFFKIVRPKDSERRMRSFPSTLRGLFARIDYTQHAGIPASPEALQQHVCIGAGVWNLRNGQGSIDVAPQYRVTTFDPFAMCPLVLDGFGIAVLPLYMARQPGISSKLVRILPSWEPKPAIHSALYFGSPSLAPKIKVFLDFVSDIFGTERDPRVGGAPSEGLFGPSDGS